MNLTQILDPRCIRIPLQSREKFALISELVAVMAEVHGISDVSGLQASVLERERTRSTGIGHGLAIPHGKSNLVDRLIMGIGRPAVPVEFESIDHVPVRMIAVLISPPANTSEHIQALARISRLMTLDACRDALYHAATPEEAYRLLEHYESSRAGA